MRRLIALIGLAVILTGCGVEYSDGSRVGTIYKFSRKGVFFKTWEGEMNVGGIAQNASGVVVPNTWEFSVMDSQVVERINKAQLDGNRVQVKYKQYMAVWPSWGKTDYIVQDVVEI